MARRGHQCHSPGFKFFGQGVNVTAIGPARACGVEARLLERTIAFGGQARCWRFSSAYGNFASAFGALQLEPLVNRYWHEAYHAPFEVACSAASPYSLPGCIQADSLARASSNREKAIRHLIKPERWVRRATARSDGGLTGALEPAALHGLSTGDNPPADETVRCGVGTAPMAVSTRVHWAVLRKWRRLFFNGGVAMTATDTVVAELTSCLRLVLRLTPRRSKPSWPLFRRSMVVETASLSWEWGWKHQPRQSSFAGQAINSSGDSWL